MHIIFLRNSFNRNSRNMYTMYMDMSIYTYILSNITPVNRSNNANLPRSGWPASECSDENATIVKNLIDQNRKKKDNCRDS